MQLILYFTTTAHKGIKINVNKNMKINYDLQRFFICMKFK